MLRLRACLIVLSLGFLASGAGEAHAISLPAAPTFRPHPASFEETEELLLVPGMTPDLFYGGYYHDPQGRLVFSDGGNHVVARVEMSGVVNVIATGLLGLRLYWRVKAAPQGLPRH